jgi:hypothetical protein
VGEVFYPYVHHCKQCGKEIFPTPEWAYKRGRKYYCSWKCLNQCKPEKQFVMPKVGDRIRIISISCIPSYAGKEGVVKSIDFMGQLHGTWGSLVVVPSEDKIKIIGGEE